MFRVCFGCIRCRFGCFAFVSVVRASSTNEDTLGTLLGFAGFVGLVGGSVSLSLSSVSVCSCFLSEGRQFRHFAWICGCFGARLGKRLSLPFLLSVLPPRTKAILGVFTHWTGELRVSKNQPWNNTILFLVLPHAEAAHGMVAVKQRLSPLIWK